MLEERIGQANIIGTRMSTPATREPSPASATPAISHHALEVRSRLALEAAGVGTWSWDAGSPVVNLDSWAQKLFGLHSEETVIAGTEIEHCIHPEDRQRVRAELDHTARDGTDLNCEFRVVWSADQSIHFVRARGKVFHNDKCQCAGMTGALWDTTERAEIQEELAHERFLLRTLMEHMPDKIYFKDRASHFTRVSNALVKWHGAVDAASVLGKTDADFFSAEHAKQAFIDEQEIIRTGRPLVNLEEKETWPNGLETWVSTTKLPLCDDNGKVIGTFGISRDITDRRRAETQLAKSVDELRTRHAELEEDLAMARELQSALLPKDYPFFPPHAKPNDPILRFSHFFNPSKEVSGDFFDILELSDSTAGIFICDVMGHGMRAALVAAIVRALVGELRDIAKVPGEFLNRLNRKLFSILKETGITVFASAAYVVVDLAKGEVRYSNAGHPDPLWIHHESGVAAALPLNHCKRGPVLGLFEEAQYGTSRNALSDGDMVLLFTDGLFEVESANGELYDQDRLFGAVQRRASLSATDLCREVLDEVQQFSADKHFSDDVCLVAIEVDRAP